MILQKTDSKTIKILTTLILDSKAVVIPCDTIYGLSAIYGKGEDVLKKLKERDASKNFLVLATSKQAEELCSDIPKEISDLWPCNLTAILKLKTGGTIGIRVPDDPFLNKLLNEVKSPIYSTSVNISGQPALLDFTSIKKRFENSVSAIVQGQEVQGTIASTIVDATSKPFKIIRQGNFNADKLIEKSGEIR